MDFQLQGQITPELLAVCRKLKLCKTTPKNPCGKCTIRLEHLIEECKTLQDACMNIGLYVTNCFMISISQKPCVDRYIFCSMEGIGNLFIIEGLTNADMIAHELMDRAKDMLTMWALSNKKHVNEQAIGMIRDIAAFRYPIGNSSLLSFSGVISHLGIVNHSIFDSINTEKAKLANNNVKY